MPTADNDNDLFRKTMNASAVKPLTAQARVALKSKTPHDIAQKKREAASRVIIEEDSEPLSDHIPELMQTGEHITFRKPGLQHQQFKKLKNGQIVCEAEIDLHGYRIEEARVALTVFLRRCQNRGFKCVHVIHGKGLSRTDTEITIKKAVANWLYQLNSVMGFASCLPADGGTGALYVLLKRAKRADNTD